MLQAILRALGVADEAEALAAIGESNAFLTSIREACGVERFADALNVIRDNAATIEKLSAIVGRSGPGLVGAVAALADKAAKTDSLEIELEEIQIAAEARDAEQLIESAVKDGRLSPGRVDVAKSLYSDHGVDALRAFVEALLPSVALGEADERREAAPQTESVLSDEERSIAKQMGVSDEWMINAKNEYRASHEVTVG